ncbi:MAG: hypothetical protein ACKO47_05570 [Alphaproteobacteria bacterium]
MDLQNFVKKPIVKIIAFLVVIYLVLFKNGKHRNTVLDNFAFNKVTNEIGEVKRKYDEISQKVETAKKIQNQINTQSSINDLQFEELFSGSGDYSIKCSDKLKVMYKIFNDQLKIIDFSEGTQIVVGQAYQEAIAKILSKAVEGRKNGAVIKANLIGNYDIEDTHLKKLLADNLNKVTVEIYILDLVKGNNAENNCQ